MVTYFAKCSDVPCFSNRGERGGIFLDRDGTIIEEKNYLREIVDLHFLPGAVSGLQKLGTTGLPMFVFTNQAGVAHGYFDEAALNRIHFFMVSKLKNAGIKLRGVFYCPHHPQAEIEAYRSDCFCRKPNPGLLKLAANIENLALTKSYVIGDKIIDLTAGKKVGAKTALVLTGYGPRELKNLPPETVPDFIGENLEEIACWIIDDLRQQATVLKQAQRRMKIGSIGYKHLLLPVPSCLLPTFSVQSNFHISGKEQPD